MGTGFVIGPCIMQERRHSVRTRTLRAGKILFNNKRSVIDCMVRNISAHGACLLVANVVGIPQTFDLVIDGEPASRPCTVAWHAQNRLGVEFRSA
jgi:hypothetical protein